MKISSTYKPRPIRCLGLLQHAEWILKVYSISYQHERIRNDELILVKSHLNTWLSKSQAYPLESYHLATLILHEAKEGVFANINWWIGENMLQNFVYLKKVNDHNYKLYSEDGMATCVWEMAIWWHERNSWVKYILMQNEKPNVDEYLKDQLNIDI